MRRDPRAYLWDVREAGGLIAEFVRDIAFEEFCTNALVRSAVERQFEVIGEAYGHATRRS